MDPHKMGLMIAVGGPKAPSGDGAMGGDEAAKHGAAAMAEFASALEKGDHEGMWNAFCAADAICEEGGGGGEEPPEGEGEEAGEGEEGGDEGAGQ